MLIKHKLITNAVVVVAAMVIMLSVIMFATGSLKTDINIARSIGVIESDILQLRRNEKDFLARKTLKYFDKFNKKVKSTQIHINDLDIALKEHDINSSNIPIFQYCKEFLKATMIIFPKSLKCKKTSV
jgi:methyl-accepting chemotaxis protein